MMESNNKSHIGYKIRSIRGSFNLSQDRFGSKIGVTGKSISAYETGKCIPSLKVLESISKTYNTTIIQSGTTGNTLVQHLNTIKKSLNEIEDMIDKSLSL